MAKPAASFRVGKVQGYVRGEVWYLCYYEDGRRRRPRVGPDKDAARQLAAQVNAQLQTGAPAALSFEPIGILELRQRWLDHHEHVLRSSVQTVNRYRTASDHLLRYLETHPVRHASHFQDRHAEQFIRHLRGLRVSPNGHAHTLKRPLMDKGLRYILECCRALFNFAIKRRHMPPYASNPFQVLEIDRIPIEQARPITLFTAEQERAFFEACDDWQFPLFLTLAMTGLRPGELAHLLLPDDLDLDQALLRVRNKPGLGWQVKTRNERDIPLVPELVDVLRVTLAGRRVGLVFLRRSKCRHTCCATNLVGSLALEREMAVRLASHERDEGQPPTRSERSRLARRLWREIGIVKGDLIRVEFMRLTGTIDLPTCTAPKVLRHQFATTLQEARVDPLIRNELMGHVAAGERSAGHGLGMTSVYTHTRPQTRRHQLVSALASREAVAVARNWLKGHSG